MAGVLFYLPNARQLSMSGAILPGWKLQFYVTNTTTPTPVYANGAMTTPLSNPVVADGAGEMVPIYMNPDVIYRVRLYTAADVLIDDVDPFDVSRGSGGGGGVPAHAFANVGDGGALIRWTNIESAEHLGSGQYEIVFTSGTFTTAPIVTVTPHPIGELGFAAAVVFGESTNHVFVQILDAAGDPDQAEFNLQAWEPENT